MAKRTANIRKDQVRSILDAQHVADAAVCAFFSVLKSAAEDDEQLCLAMQEARDEWSALEYTIKRAKKT